MKAPERDALLIRLDERSNNSWRAIESIQNHLEIQNGHLLELIQTSQRNTIFRRWAERLIIPIVAFIVGWLAKLQGWIF